LPFLPYACDHYNTILLQKLEDISYKTIKLILINYAAVEKCSKNTRKGHCKILSTIDQVLADQKCKYNNVTRTLRSTSPLPGIYGRKIMWNYK
jgi:hypothetical protein